MERVEKQRTVERCKDRFVQEDAQLGKPSIHILVRPLGKREGGREKDAGSSQLRRTNDK